MEFEKTTVRLATFQACLFMIPAIIALIILICVL